MVKLNRLSLACILGVLLLSSGFWADFLASLVRGLLPISEETGQPDSTKQTKQPLANCHVETSRPAILTIFAGAEIGTGSIVSSDGLVLTNEHVVREVGSRGEIHARQWGGTLYKGQVLATNATHDLALVKISTKEPLPTIAFAKPEEIQSGQGVCALGSPRAITGVLARGKLIGTRGTSDLKSAILLQPGNSGGPLLNQQGEMIGVNKSIWLSETGENVGLSFATNVVTTTQFFEQNKSKSVPTESPIADHVTPLPLPSKPLDFNPPVIAELPYKTDSPYRPYPSQPSESGAHLGAIVDERTLVIQIVEPESPAEQAGLNAGDRLIKVNNQPLERLEDLKAFLATKRDRATFTVSRDNKPQDVTVEF
ncbi:S1C family serine protease [Stenomitos frigidus]|uniref:PDZ domain-containing protein n=1 Tax=Stenomitos frigidus ULC18 TaxID=2107698 RepID=A0A2T1E2Q5_9CYAN|nr:trypsin-like peptidase domain-containing protein [Stenomitos frigidus]PSB26991.1 hypothetical protein C7B82_17700 [Stenomitos frigidus ULC18]